MAFVTAHKPHGPLRVNPKHPLARGLLVSIAVTEDAHNKEAVPQRLDKGPFQWRGRYGDDEFGGADAFGIGRVGRWFTPSDGGGGSRFLNPGPVALINAHSRGFTSEVVVKPLTAIDNNECIFFLGQPNPVGSVWQVRGSNAGSGFRFFMHDSSPSPKGIESSQNYVQDEYNHVVATWDGVTQKLYVNGGLVASSTDLGGGGGIANVESSLMFGSSQFGQDCENCEIAGGGFWLRALTADEVLRASVDPWERYRFQLGDFGVGENVQFRISAIETVTEGDTVAVSDALAEVAILVESLAGSAIGLSDALGEVAIYVETLAASVSLADSAAVIHQLDLDLMESVPVMDSLAAAYVGTVADGDTVAASDALAAVAILKQALVDTVVVSDLPTVICDVLLELADSIPVTDELATGMMVGAMSATMVGTDEQSATMVSTNELSATMVTEN